MSVTVNKSTTINVSFSDGPDMSNRDFEDEVDWDEDEVDWEALSRVPTYSGNVTSEEDGNWVGSFYLNASSREEFLATFDNLSTLLKANV